MREFIKTSNGLCKEIQEKFGLTKAGVWKMTHFLSNSDLADRVRTYALAHGGRLVREEFCPDCETEHVGGMIIQRFAGEVVLTVDTRRGTGTIRQHGQVCLDATDLTVNSWANLCAEAQRLSLGAPAM